MSVLCRWCIVEMPDYDDNGPDMMERAYILLKDHGSGEFAFGVPARRVAVLARSGTRAIPIETS